MEYRDEQNEEYVMDLQAGPVYGSRPVKGEEVMRLSRKRDVPQIIQVLVWPYRESSDQSVMLRRYYALNLPQAVARATEIEIRLREQQVEAVLVGVRPATTRETNTFFKALDALESAACATESQSGGQILFGIHASEQKTISRQKPACRGKWLVEEQNKKEVGRATKTSDGELVRGAVHQEAHLSREAAFTPGDREKRARRYRPGGKPNAESLPQ